VTSRAIARLGTAPSDGWETLRLGLDLAGRGAAGDTRTRSEQAVALFDLATLLDRPVRYLSAGQRRRVALARLAGADAPLWLMDEPTVALDGPSTAAVVDAITAHCAGGGMAVIATHLELPLAGAALLDLDSLPRTGMGDPADLMEIAAQ
jgi:ABC-type transport system involved in cytochrome c biogenesis ATPase subunit